MKKIAYYDTSHHMPEKVISAATRPTPVPVRTPRCPGQGAGGCLYRAHGKQRYEEKSVRRTAGGMEKTGNRMVKLMNNNRIMRMI
jgi:hypothetical protein